MSMREAEADALRERTPNFAPTHRHLRLANLLIDAVTKHGSEAVHRLVGRLSENDAAIITGVLARRCAHLPDPPEYVAPERDPARHGTETGYQRLHARVGRPFPEDEGKPSCGCRDAHNDYERAANRRRREKRTAAQREARTEALARAMFDRQAATYDADPALTELAWIDPAIRKFWCDEATAVLRWLEEHPHG